MAEKILTTLIKIWAAENGYEVKDITITEKKTA